MLSLTDKLIVVLVSGVAAFIFGVLIQAAAAILFGSTINPLQTGVLCLVAMWATLLLSSVFDRG